MLSRGWIRAAGHYYSQVAKETKEMIFPTDYDATKMFWLINRSGAHGCVKGDCWHTPQGNDIQV